MVPLSEAETRFAFGKNWNEFLKQIDSERAAQAVVSLRQLLQLDPGVAAPLEGKTFLDIGSGSGLFSLAAVALGAAVVSLDIDPDSVECTRRLKAQFESSGRDSSTTFGCRDSARNEWRVHQLSVLDSDGMSALGMFDIVYSWGVLHHTGAMAAAIEAASRRVAPGGLFAIAIYNDQGGASRRWHAIKRGYHAVPSCLRGAYVAACASFYEVKFALARLASGRSPLPLADWRAKRADRGMSVWHDWVDWIGGIPFEVATPETIIMPLRRQGFTLEHLRTVGSGWGCNEYVFLRERVQPNHDKNS